MERKRERILPGWMKSSETVDTSTHPNVMDSSHSDVLVNKTLKCVESSSGESSPASECIKKDEDDVVDLPIKAIGEETAVPADNGHNSLSSSDGTLSACFSSSKKDENDCKNPVTGSSPQPTRQSCVYGTSCYRKNPQHRVEYAHPADGDYIEPSTSSGHSSPIKKPLCKYGDACYRKNPQHRLEFSHDVSKGRKARPTNMQDLQSDEEDAFLGHGSSDDYKPGHSESDDSFVTSDSAGSGESDFDPEDGSSNDDSPKKKGKRTKTGQKLNHHKRKKKKTE